jgi:putative glutamine amidotransferase
VLVKKKKCTSQLNFSTIPYNYSFTPVVIQIFFLYNENNFKENRMKKTTLFFTYLLFIFAILAIPNVSNEDITIILCRPLTSQIKNIEVLYEKDLIKIDRLHLICLYHENEFTSYKNARRYVRENDLDWVQFQMIRGMEKTSNIFKKNIWTEQFLKLFNFSRGIIFTGGMDLPPTIYNGKTSILTEPLTPVRSYYETSFLFHLIGSSRNPAFKPFLEWNPRYVILGICLGCQTLNVAAGGTLCQDIPTRVYKVKSAEEVLKLNRGQIHSARYIKMLNPMIKDLSPAFHTINLLKDSLFTKQMGFSWRDHPLILSSHHQALKKIGLNLRVIATSPDGRIVEAVQHKEYPNVLGVQFHPEYNSLYLKSKYFRKKPGMAKSFNLRSYLRNNSPSMKFHHKIWEWFSKALTY